MADLDGVAPAAPPPAARHPPPPTAVFSVGASASNTGAKTSSAWRSWACPVPGSSSGGRHGDQETAPKKPSKHEMKIEHDKRSAAATAAAKKAAEAAEASVRLATLAAKQIAQSVATPQNQRKRLKTELPLAKPDNEKGEAAAAVAPQSQEEPAQEPDDAAPMPVPVQTGGSSCKKEWGSAGTFAGRRPPKGEDKTAQFNLKKKLWQETRKSLQEKFPGRAQGLMKTTSQEAYYKFIGDHLKASLKKKKKKSTHEDVCDAIRKGSKKWKEHKERELNQ